MIILYVLVNIIILYFLGLGLSASDQEFLMAAVSPPTRSYMHLTKDTSGLGDISDNIMAYLCNGK